MHLTLVTMLIAHSYESCINPCSDPKQLSSRSKMYRPTMWGFNQSINIFEGNTILSWFSVITVVGFSCTAEQCFKQSIYRFPTRFEHSISKVFYGDLKLTLVGESPWKWMKKDEGGWNSKSVNYILWILEYYECAAQNHFILENITFEKSSPFVVFLQTALLGELVMIMQDSGVGFFVSTPVAFISKYYCTDISKRLLHKYVWLFNGLFMRKDTGWQQRKVLWNISC